MNLFESCREARGGVIFLVEGGPGSGVKGHTTPHPDQMSLFGDEEEESPKTNKVTQPSVDNPITVRNNTSGSGSVPDKSHSTGGSKMVTSNAKHEISGMIDKIVGRYTAEKGIRAMLDSDSPTHMNKFTTNSYKDEPEAVAAIVEKMVAAGLVTAEPTKRWWPSQLEAVRDAWRNNPIKDAVGVELQDNPPVVVIKSPSSGNIVVSPITEATPKGLQDAIDAANKEMKSRTIETKKRIAAERQVNRE